MERTYDLSPWDLSQLYDAPDSPSVLEALKELDQKVAEIEGFRNGLSADLPVEDFYEMIRKLEAVNRLATRIGAFAGLLFAADTQDQTAQAFMAKIEQIMAGLQNRTLFFDLWWKGLDDSDADRFMAGAGEWRYWLEEMRHFKPHTLSEPEEKIINIKNVTGASAMTTLYDSITNRYVFKLEEDGRTEELTRGGLMVYAHHHDPELRAAAYRELYRVYGQDGPILGQIYQHLTRDWHNENLDFRSFGSPIGVRNLSNDLPDDVVELLLSVCDEQAPLFQRFFRMKARLLKMDRLRRYDIYAPLTPSTRKYRYDEAVHLVMNAFERFDPLFARQAIRVFDDRHIDSEVRKGKRDGAFCAGVLPEMTPYVLVNFQGRAEDAATLAHELGHAVHDMLASEHSVFTHQPSLPLAENASTFGEMLLLEHLLAEEKDERVHRDLLFRQLDDAYATILRQSFFARFEIAAHQMVQDGFTVDDICQAYMENLGRQFGDAVEVSDEFKWEWVSIPHIYHTPFYVYAYSFGQLLVFSLYREYKKDPVGFKPRYIKLLSTGGSKSPADMLAEAGLDMHSADFWRGGFAVVKDLLDRLEAEEQSRNHKPRQAVLIWALAIIS